MNLGAGAEFGEAGIEDAAADDVDAFAAAALGTPISGGVARGIGIEVDAVRSGGSAGRAAEGADLVKAGAGNARLRADDARVVGNARRGREGALRIDSEDAEGNVG